MVEWRDEELGDVWRQRVLRVDPGGRDVPAVLWTPRASPGPFPLVLIGHGGAGHKLDDSRLDLAQRYIARGVAAAAIDGPWHGERAGPSGSLDDEKQVDRMVADWRVTLDALVALPDLDAAHVACGGVSMGTMFGLPFVAADSRIGAAMFGLCGLQRRVPHGSLAIADRLKRDARALCIPVLFLMQWNDELFDRAGVLALFDAVGSSDKRLLASVGLHHETPPDARAASTDFLATRLAAPVLG